MNSWKHTRVTVVALAGRVGGDVEEVAADRIDAGGPVVDVAPTIPVGAAVGPSRSAAHD